jgi:hypothetical protein
MSQKSQRKTKKASAKVSVRKSGKVVAKAQAKAVGKGKVVAVAQKHSKKQPKKHSKKQMRGGNGYSMAVDQDRVGGQTVRKRYTECPEGGVFAALSKLWQ